jgi:hypothetical protein
MRRCVFSADDEEKLEKLRSAEPCAERGKAEIFIGLPGGTCPGRTTSYESQ